MDSDYCTICHNYSLDRDDENFIIGNNPIIYCSCCNIGVHLKCIGYTEVPETLNTLGKQRRRWARGMIEAFKKVKVITSKKLNFKSKFLIA